MPLGYGLWVWFKNSPAAQIAVGIGVVYTLFRVWLWRKIAGVRKDEQQKIEIEAQDKSRQVIAKAEEKTHDVIEKADEARADIPRGAPSGELPKHVQDILFDD